MNVQEILTSKLAITPFLERPPSGPEDATLERSIRDTGIQQPLAAVQIGDTLQVVDGGRRLLIAKRLSIPKVRVAIYDLPATENPRLYPLKLRFILDQHRQDLLPTQRAELLAKIKEAHGFGNTEMAAYLGVVPESIRNWLSPLSYCKEVQGLLDSSRLTMNGARVFEGMTEKGQRYVLEHHLGQLEGPGDKGDLTATLRRKYPPNRFPHMYTNPEASARNLDIAKRRRGAVRTKVANTTMQEKKRLLDSVELKTAEIEENKSELAELKADILAAVPIVAAIMRNKAIREVVPAEVMEEIQAFAKVYVS